MYRVTAKYSVSDYWSGYSEWEDTPCQSLRQAMDLAFDMCQHPEDHEVSGDDQDPSSEDYFSTYLRTGCGIFVTADGSNAFSGHDDHAEYVPLPLEAGDNGSAYGFPEQKPLHVRWFLVARRANGLVQQYGWYQSAAEAQVQANGFQRRAPDGDRFYAVSGAAITSFRPSSIDFEAGIASGLVRPALIEKPVRQ